MTATEDVLDGVCESTAKLIKAMTEAMTTCWSARQANPQMIVQHGSAGDHMRMHPQEARRWQAARVRNDRREDWY